MLEVLHWALVVLLAASLATVAAYALAFFGLAAWGALRRPPRDPLAEELDRLLEEVAKTRARGVLRPAGSPAGQLGPGREPWRSHVPSAPFRDKGGA